MKTIARTVLLALATAALVAGCAKTKKTTKKAGDDVKYVAVEVGDTTVDLVKKAGQPVKKAADKTGDGVVWTYEEGTHVIVKSGKVIASPFKRVASTLK